MCLILPISFWHITSPLHHSARLLNEWQSIHNSQFKVICWIFLSKGASGVYIINKTIYEYLYLNNFYPHVQLNFSLVCCKHTWGYQVECSKRNSVSMQTCVLFPMYMYEPKDTDFFGGTPVKRHSKAVEQKWL